MLGSSATNPFSQKPCAHALQRPFPLLSDFPALKVMRSYGGLSQAVELTLAQRWFVLVDLQGIVRGQWRGTSTDVFPSAMMLKVVPEVVGQRETWGTSEAVG